MLLISSFCVKETFVPRGTTFDTFEKEDYCNRLYEIYVNGKHNKFSKHK